MSNGRDCLDVSYLQCGVRRSFAKNKLCVRLHMFLYVVQISEINEVKFHSKRYELFSTDSIRASVSAICYDTVITSFHYTRNDKRCCRHSRSNGCRTEPVF